MNTLGNLYSSLQYPQLGSVAGVTPPMQVGQSVNGMFAPKQPSWGAAAPVSQAASNASWKQMYGQPSLVGQGVVAQGSPTATNPSGNIYGSGLGGVDGGMAQAGTGSADYGVAQARSGGRGGLNMNRLASLYNSFRRPRTGGGYTGGGMA